jgi:hypothetical protein
MVQPVYVTTGYGLGGRGSILGSDKYVASFPWE